MVKHLPAVQETWFDPWVGKIPSRRRWRPTPVFLPGKSHDQRVLRGYSPRGHKELDVTKQLHFHLHWIIIRDLSLVVPEWPGGFVYFLQFKPEFCSKEFMVWAAVSSWSCFCLIYQVPNFSFYKIGWEFNSSSTFSTKPFLIDINYIFLTCSSNNTREDSTYGHHQMVNIKIRLIIFFAAKDREVLQSQQKQDQEQTGALIMSSLLSNSEFNWRK